MCPTARFQKVYPMRIYLELPEPSRIQGRGPIHRVDILRYW